MAKKKIYRISISNLSHRKDTLHGIQTIVNHWERSGTPLNMTGHITLPEIGSTPKEPVKWIVKQTKTYISVELEGLADDQVNLDQESASEE